MRKPFLLSLLVALLSTLSLLAYDFKSGDLYYNITGENTVAVTYQDGSESNYHGLTTATIPATVTYNGTTYYVTSIGGYAFDYCISLTSITIPNSVTSIGESAFKDCSSLTSITLPNSVTSIGWYAFGRCTSLPVEDNLRYADTYLVEAVDKSLSTYTIKAGTKWIGEYAFQDCSSLTSITLPNSVTSIGGVAFYGCSSLTSITLPNSVTSIGDHAFRGCSSLTSITLPNSITSIGSRAFLNCSSLTSITIPNSVTSIGEYAFAGCSSLTSVVWNAKNCAGWSSSSYAPFYDIRANITSFTFGEEVETIPSYLCYGMSSLTSITIPNSVSGELVKVDSLNPNAVYFVNMEGWANIHVHAWDDEGSGTTWPGEMATLADFTYQGYDVYYFTATPGKYEYCIFNDGGGTQTEDLTWTGGQAYFNNEWHAIKVDPYYKVSIGANAFCSCSFLTDITCLAVNPPTCVINAFNDVPSEATLWCPCESRAEYQSAHGWSQFNRVYPLDFPQATILTDTDRGRAQIDELICTPQSVVISATPYDGYVFTRWSDGNTDNPRTVLLTHDTTLTAEFGLAYSGMCGDNLYWEYKDKVLTIIGNGEMYNAIQWRLLRDSIYSVSLPNSVTNIGDYVFSGCSSLTSLTIPDSVTSIGEYAFAGCSSLTSVVWNAKNCAGWSSSSYAPFYDIRANITSFTFGEEVETIPSYLCYGMSSLTSITIPNSVTSIGDCAFGGCSSLTSVTIPDSVTSIGEYAFAGCSSLTSVVWNAKNCAGWSSSSYAPFYDSRANITSFTFGEEVETIPACLCYGMSSLTSITLPNSVTSIGERAFSSCSSLTSITIPDSVTSIGEYAFAGCSSLTSVVWNAKNCAGWSSSSYAPFYDSRANITSFTFGEEVETIPACLCYGMSSLTSITLPNSVTSIGERAFSSCSSLTSLTIPDSVTSIGEYAFAGCSSLTSVVWNAKNCAGWSSSSYAPFYDSRANITSFTFGEEVETIPACLCYGMSSLTSITFPNSVTSIGSSAFNGCSSLTKTNYTGDLASWCAISFSSVESNPTFYSHNLYINDVEVKDLVTFPETVTIIGSYAFSGCTSITSLNIPNSVTSIGESAFYNCSSLTSITIPDSVTNIGEYAFAGCSSLTSVVWNAKNCAGWSSSSYAPFYEICANITSFTFGEEVETIPSYLCDGMSSLTSITLPNSVTSIGYWAFSGCSSLTSITIPNSVTSIGDNAFYNCSSLADIYCYATTPPVCDGSTYSGSFRGVSKHCYIHVPAGTIRDYQMADGWRDFYHFYEISELPDGAPTDQVGVTVTGNYATFSWPVNPTASSYTLTITKDGEVFCTLIFNNMGQLVGMAFAPARNGKQSANQDDAQSTAYGFSFVVTNLDANSHYTYTFTVNGADNEVIETCSGAFDTTEETTALSETEQQNKPSRKILRDGQVLILRNGVAYDMMGNML